MAADFREVGNASSAWLLMGKGYRISRSIRLQWFFQHLNTIVSPKPEEEIVESNEELEVLSVIEDQQEVYEQDDDCINEPSTTTSSHLRIVPTTRLSFVARQYRFAYCIDMSPSLATVDTQTGDVLVDDMFNNLRNSLMGLVQPFCIENSSLELCPRLYITVLAHTYTNEKECQVLMQGFCLNRDNIRDFLCKLRRKLGKLCERLIKGITSKQKDTQSQSTRKSNNTNQTSLFHMIRDSLLAVHLLPDHASAAIVVVTDGVFILENAYVTDALLAQCRNSTAVVSFLQVGSGYGRASVEMGFVPHCALMQFIATATSGAFLAICPHIKEDNQIDKNKMNIYHKALLCWNFQRDLDRDKVISHMDGAGDINHLFTWGDIISLSSDQHGQQALTIPPQPQQTMRYMELVLKTKISGLLSLRAREGYITDGIKFHRNKQDYCKIEVKLMWPWKEHVAIEYIAKATWPLESGSDQTHVVVNVTGPYEFLVDITSQRPKTRKPLRKIVLQRFEHTIKSLETSDVLLVQLQSFSTQENASKIPETTAKGSPLFYMQPNSNTPILALQYGGQKSRKSTKSPEAQFANFWKPIVTMDTRTWSKWFHCHRISILLEHDRPIAKDLFVPSSSGQFPIVQCRSAISSFNRLLKEWCDFILLENHSYVKFMSRSPGERPYTFCVLRLTFKGICIIIKLGFLLGTPGIERSKVTEDLKLKLSKLKAPIEKFNNKESSDVPVRHSSQQLKEREEQSCVVFMTKQFERILVKYETLPDEVRSCGHTSQQNASQKPSTHDERDGSLRSYQNLHDTGALGALGQYLFNQRWVWSMGSSANIEMDASSISQILGKIMRQRTCEGFHFCSNAKGIITMVKEVNVIVSSSEENLSNCCIIQYVIFPPHSQLLMKPSEDSTESDVAFQEVEGDLQMVIEVWVEPQLGTIDEQDSPLSYLHGEVYNKIPEKMFEMDAKIVLEICSYLLLHKSCFNNVLNDTMPERGTPLPTIPSDTFVSASIVRVPLLFQVVPLLYKSKLIVSFYPMMCAIKQDTRASKSQHPNDILLGYLFKTLLQMNDVTLDLKPEEKHAILAHLKQRCHVDSHMWKEHKKHLLQFCPPTDTETVASVDGDDVVNFKCFLKSYGSCIVIVLVPSSIKDLCVLDTNQRNEADNQRNHLPFFIFECEYETMKTIPSLSKSQYHLDVVQDYTDALSESELIPRHINQKLPDECSREIIMYCQALYDHYFWALVSGVYDCLKNKYILHPDDVSSSIELFCEESTKEIDITSFLRTLCSHYRANTLIVDQFAAEDIVFPDSGVHAYHPENKPLSRLQKRSSSGSSSFRSSRTSLRLRNGECDNVTLAEEIKRLFMSILGKYFEQVPNDEYYLFFNDKRERESVSADFDSSSQTTSSARSSVTTLNREIFHSSDNNLSSGPESDHLLEDDVVYVNTQSTRDSERPMFLHLTCSVHYKTADDNIMRPLSVSSLPTCLGEIFNQLSECGRQIDPYSQSLVVTLDLICLSQPSEPEEDEGWEVPKEVLVQRQRSSDSFYSSHSQGTRSIGSRGRLLSSTTSRDGSYIRQPSDSIQNLPEKQRCAVEKACEGIEWLLEDEIASALRTQVPITEESLTRVAKHIQNSQDSPNCVFKKKDFNFVTGLEKVSNHCCLPMFFAELEEASAEYNLKRIGKYYCVVGGDDLLLEEESDVESVNNVMDEVKEKAKIVRRGMGHRRSQSDFANNRHEAMEKVKSANKTSTLPRHKSWPSVYDPLMADANFIYGIGQSSSHPNHGARRPVHDPIRNHKGSISAEVVFSIDDDDDDEDSSKEDRYSPMPPPFEDKEFLQRSMSYSEYQKEDIQLKRRHFSMPNIYRPGKQEDTLIAGSGDNEDQSDDYVEEKELMKKSSRIRPPPSQNKDGGADSVVYEDDEMLHPHPQFWLFMYISEESVNVYLHHRQSELAKNVENHRGFFDRLLDHIEQICKIVNQRSLLEHLYGTYTVHNLLIEDEEKLWNASESENEDNIVVFKSRDSTTTTPFGAVIHGEYKFQPGFFECDMVWQQSIPIHSRLSTTSTTGGMSKAMLAVRSVLSRFKAINRDNVFVIKEQLTNNVVYVRLKQGPNHNGRLESVPATFDEEDDDRMFQPVDREYSRTSSMTTINKQDDELVRFDFERRESFHSAQFMQSKFDDKSSTSESLQQQDHIFVCVYGIREPGLEIKEDVMKLITKKLESATLDLINQQIARNPKCQLTPQDVEFIQPSDGPPTRQIRVCITEYALKYLHAAMFYFHQHLLKKYNRPRYTSDDPNFHFKNCTSKKRTASSSSGVECKSSNNIYLYNRREKSDIGIGIIHITLVDPDGKNVVAQPCFPTLAYEHHTLEELYETLQQIVKAKRFDHVFDDDTDYFRNILIQINIWQNGEINIYNFERELLGHLQNALYDVFLEFHLLCTPFSDIPRSYRFCNQLSRDQHHSSSFSHVRSSVPSSNSSSATTPKFGRPLTTPSGKKYSSEPGTPIDVRFDSPSATRGKHEDFTSEASYTLSTKGKEDSFDSSQNKRDSPITGKDSPFTKKDSPSLHRKLSARGSSPMLRKRSASSRASSIRSESELSVPLINEDAPKTITMNQLNQMRTTSNDPSVTDLDVLEAVGEFKKTTWQDLEVQRRLDLEKCKEKRKYEHGTIGNLHPNYHNNVALLLNLMLQKNNVSIHKHEGFLTHSYSMEIVMKEFVKELHEKCPDVKPKAFKHVNRYTDGALIKTFPIYVERNAVKTSEKGESSMEHDRRSVSIVPGDHSEFIVVGHNAHKWLLSMGIDEEDLSDDEEGKSQNEHTGKQYFSPLILHNPGLSSQERRQYSNEHPPCIVHAFVPRQKFFIAIFSEKKISFYSYNFSTDATTSIDRQMKRLYAWHNVRTHLNACLFTQKLGLFHHKLFTRNCPSFNDPNVKDIASRNNVIPLMTEVSAKVKERHKTEHHPVRVPIPDCDEMFRNIFPTKPIQQTSYFTLSDLVKRQGCQYQDVKKTKIHIAYEETRLKEIFDAWKQEGAHVPIMEERLHLLKRRSRFLHYCYAPVFFKDYDGQGQELSSSKNVVKLFGSDSAKISSRGKLKDDWYTDLKWKLMQQYIQYLQTLGLCVVQFASKSTSKSTTQPTSPLNRNLSNTRQTARSNSMRYERDETIVQHRDVHRTYHLQKTMNGGIILMDVFFKRNNLCYKMSAFQLGSLNVMSHVTEKDQSQFYGDCNRYKDLTHLRSFTYDFHVREIQNHLSGRHSKFQKSYPVHKLMELILMEYPKPPRFCRCILANDFVSIPCSPGLSPSTVYKYLVRNSSVYDLSRVTVPSLSDPSSTSSSSSSSSPSLSSSTTTETTTTTTHHYNYVLTYGYHAEKEPIQFPESWRTRRDKTEYDGNVAVYFRESESTPEVINVPYFVCLGNKKEFYPRPHMLSNVSSLKQRQRGVSTMDTMGCTDVDAAAKNRNRVRFSGTNESQENATVHEVHSAGNLRRLPSWNMADGTISLRSTESDTSLSSVRNIYSPRLSPSRANFFRMSPDQHLSGGSPDSDASTETVTRITALSNSTQETYFINEVKFVNQEIARVRDNLTEKVGRCLSNCWRDLLWQNLLAADGNLLLEADEKRLKKKTTPVDATTTQLLTFVSQWQQDNIMSNVKTNEMCVTYNTMKQLIKLVKQYKIVEIEKRISDSYFYVQPVMQKQLIRNLINKYGPYCRRFVSDDGDNSFLCILNAGNLDMFYLIEANALQGTLELSVVYRYKPSSSPLECKEYDSLTQVEKTSRRHIESVNSCLCYNLWLQLLPT